MTGSDGRSPEEPLVCIAMPAYNASSTIALAIRSVLYQTYQHWHLFVVDDGSDDDTVAVAKRFKESRISILSDGKRLGLAARLNGIIEHCHGDFLARLDADDIAYPDRLRKQVQFLLNHPTIDLLGTGAIVFNQDGEARGSFPSRLSHEELCHRPWAGFYLAHPTWMGRLVWFRRYGYREDMSKAQDQDLLLRSYRASRFAALPDMLTGYRQETLSLRKIILGRYYFTKSIVREAWKHADILSLLVAPLMQVAKLFFEVFGILTGMVSFTSRHRALPIDDHSAKEWASVWEQLQ